MNKTIFEENSFFVGCNYWASNAGVDMWHDWDEAIIRKDMETLSSHGMKVLRIFPLWSDFQPIRMHLNAKMMPKEMRLREDPLPHTKEGEAGMDPVMVDRFQKLLDIGQEFGISFIVALVTGWMSGRLYVPEALLNMNPITDARSLKWQIKFVKYMVTRFKESSSIVAWDLGNECNCMGSVENNEQAYVWTSALTNTIKMCDPQRPVVSGMHGINVNKDWRIQDQGEITDILCTHPYTLYTPFCDTDPLNEMKTIIHSTAQTLMYRGFGRKKAFVEEIGSLGPSVASDDVAADFFKSCLYSAWAHNCLGAMWWCAFDQGHLKQTPYDWSGIERYLGLFRKDMEPKPITQAIDDFCANASVAGELPDRIVDAVCVICHIPDPWKAAYGTFLTAKKAGLDIEYAYIDNPLPEANAYIMPSMRGSVCIYKHQLDMLLEKVEKGATLYMSADDLLFLEPLSQLIGLEPQYRNAMTKPTHVEAMGRKLPLQGKYRTEYKVLDCDVVLRGEDGAPVLVKKAYGKGKIYFLAYPMEDIVAAQPSVCTGANEISYEKIYESIGTLRNKQKQIKSDNPYVGITEHPCEDGTVKAVLVNYRPNEQKVHLHTGRLKIQKIIGNAETDADHALILPPNDGAVIILK